MAPWTLQTPRGQVYGRVTQTPVYKGGRNCSNKSMQSGENAKQPCSEYNNNQEIVVNVRKLSIPRSKLN